MTDWYHWFLITVFVLWAFSTSKDRNALRIVLIASLASEGIVELVTKNITASWKLVVPGFVETATIVALYLWAKGRTGTLNMVLLSVAWLAHLLCYLDLWNQANIIRPRYVLIIQLIALGQIGTFHDTLGHMAARVRGWLVQIGPNRLGAFSATGVRPPVVSGKTDNGVQTAP